MAEGGMIYLNVSARPIHSLEEQLSKFPAHLLDSPCADAHLVKLSQSVAEWRDLSPYLRLSPAEERGILTAFPPATPARQRIDMLRTWRDKFGTSATYRCIDECIVQVNARTVNSELGLGVEGGMEGRGEGGWVHDWYTFEP